ncbi:MAG TPA: hypothetical protein VKL22_04690, partial [Actinomycetota bacterium]|nr:hypothetical protein [Actinomycetota bacterium]
RVLVMDGGRIVGDGSAEEILGSMPALTMDGERNGLALPPSPANGSGPARSNGATPADRAAALDSGAGVAQPVRPGP